MRKPQPPAATIFTWLRNNKIPLGALTSHDTAALLAATQVAELWLRGDPDHRLRSEIAFKNCVIQMQLKTRYMAFHAIAHCGDWCHRMELWQAAQLSTDWLKNVPECSFGPTVRRLAIDGGDPSLALPEPKPEEAA